MTDDPRPVGEVVRGLIASTRPRQWVKNVLVLAAPVLSGRITEGLVLVATLVAFVVFCLASAGVYLVNDAQDAEADRAHPVKRTRPVASGQISPGTATLTGAALTVLALVLGFAWNLPLGTTAAAYVAISVAYCLWLKHVVLADIAIIAGGFILRAVAGGAASDIVLSEWFVLAASFGSLFMAAGKRYAELSDESVPWPSTRRALEGYTPTYLRFVWTLSAGIMVATYGLWAFEERVETQSSLPIYSIAPFVLAILRYAVHVDAGKAGEPEELALSDHVLQALCVVWVVLVVVPLFG